jgi:GT2 family glycosyltransferase
MQSPPKVGVVILNWNNYSDTASCLNSLDEITYENAFVVVVDNGSEDGSGERLANEFDWCEFGFNEENLGFSGGCNVGIEYALEQGADYVLLLNNDIEVSPDFLGPLVNTAERHKRVAAVGGVIYDGHSDDVWDAGGEMRPLIANVSRYKEVKSNEEYRTEFVTCAQALLSKEFLQEHLLDEEYFFGVEEIDLSWRANKDGWKLFTNPNSEVYHDVGSSTEEMFHGKRLFSSFQKYHNTRGRLYFASKNLNPLYALSYYATALTMFPMFYLWLGVRYGRWDIIYAHFLSIYDYLTNRSIKKVSYFEK